MNRAGLRGVAAAIDELLKAIGLDENALALIEQMEQGHSEPTEPEEAFPPGFAARPGRSFETLKDFEKQLFVDADDSEAQFEKLITDTLVRWERETLARFQEVLDKSSWSTLAKQVRSKNVETRIAYIDTGSFLEPKFKFPVFLKADPGRNLDYISLNDQRELSAGLAANLLDAGQKGAVKGLTDLKLAIDFNISSESIASWYRTHAIQLSNQIARSTAGRIKEEIIAGLKLGESSAEIAERIRDVYASPIKIVVPPKVIDGEVVRRGYEYFLDGEHWAITTARSEVQRAVNNGRLYVYHKRGNVAKVRWATAADERVCPDCFAHEGITRTPKDAEGLIPLHPQCRCTWIVAGFQDPDDPVRGANVNSTPDDLYAAPGGVGIGEMSKMSAAELDQYEKLLDNGKFVEAQNWLNRFTG
jgi:SPP1 gp7 family putative phage head morphogenesis protein